MAEYPVPLSTPDFCQVDQRVKDPDTGLYHTIVETPRSHEAVRDALTNGYHQFLELAAPMAKIVQLGTPGQIGYEIRASQTQVSGGGETSVHQYTVTNCHKLVGAGSNFVRWQTSQQSADGALMGKNRATLTTYTWRNAVGSKATLVHIVDNSPTLNDVMPLCMKIIFTVFCCQYLCMLACANKQIKAVWAQSINNFKTFLTQYQPANNNPPAYAATTQQPGAGAGNPNAFCGGCGTKAVPGNAFCGACGKHL